MKNQILNVIGLTLGVYIYTYFSDQNYVEAAQNTYWLAFGSFFTYFRMRSTNQDSVRIKE